MAKTLNLASSQQTITTFAPIFQKNLERLEKLGQANSSEAAGLRRALERIALSQSRNNNVSHEPHQV